MDPISEDKWGLLLRQKEQTNRNLDKQMKYKSLEDKNNYKNDLDLQTTLKLKENLLKLEEKKSELKTVSLQNKMAESEALKKRAERSDLQRFLAKQYEFQETYKKNKQQLEYYQKLEDDKRKNLEIESQVMREHLRKQEQKKSQLRTEQKMLEIKNYEKRLKQKQEEREKQQDMENLARRLEQDSIREKKYKEFYTKIDEHQKHLQKVYANQVSPQLKRKDHQLTDWIDRNISKQAQVLESKELYERRIKQETMANIKQVWEYQLEEKANNLKQIKEEQNQLYDDIQQKVNESRKIDEIRENQKKLTQERYRQSLMSQVLGRTPPRVRLAPSPSNNFSIDDIPSSSFKPLPTSHRSNSVAPEPFHPNSPDLPSRLSQSPSNSSTYSFHNPITNPIGDNLPRPIQRPLFKPHTLIAY